MDETSDDVIKVNGVNDGPDSELKDAMVDEADGDYDSGSRAMMWGEVPELVTEINAPQANEEYDEGMEAGLEGFEDDGEMTEVEEEEFAGQQTVNVTVGIGDRDDSVALVTRGGDRDSNVQAPRRIVSKSFVNTVSPS